jgi:hypothetical protein
LKQVFKFDSNGFYVEPVILGDVESMPSGCTDIQPPDGLFKGKFVEGAWIEGLSADEIHAIKNAPVPLSDIEALKKQQADLTFTLMMAGVI